MCATSASSGRTALQRPHRERVSQIVQARAAPRRRCDPWLAVLPVEGVLDGNIAQRTAMLADEHRIIVRARPAARQIAPQARGGRIVKRYQAGLAEPGLADQA